MDTALKTPSDVPSPPTRRRRDKEARPAELLDAALDLFRERGFAATRMEDIATRAGVSKGTVYLYFPSKQAVFEAMVRTALVPELEGAMMGAGASTSTADALSALLHRLGAVMGDPRRIAIPKLVMAEAGSFPDMARFYRREVVGRVLGHIARILDRGIAAGEIRPCDPFIAARLFLAPLLINAIWQTTFAALEEGPTDPAPMMALHLETFLRGLRLEVL